MSIFSNSFKPKLNLGLESFNQEEINTPEQTDNTDITQDDNTPETPQDDDTTTVDVTDPITDEPIGEPVPDPSVDTEADQVPDPDAAEPFVAEVDTTDVIIDTDTGEVVDEEELEEGPDEDDEETEEERELDQIISEEYAIESLNTEVSQLMQTMNVIDLHGVTPSTIGVMQITGLLSSTALETIALESFKDSTKAEADLALESLGEKVKEKSAAMSAKVLKVFQSTGERISSVIKPLWDKVDALAKKVGTKTWNAAQYAGKTVKAHPYATVVAVITAIAAVAGIILFSGKSMPAAGAKPEALTAFNKRVSDMISGIKWPFGKVSASVDGGKLKTVVEGVAGGAPTEAIDKLKWNQAAIKSVTGQLDRALTAIKGAGDHLGNRGSAIAKSVGDFATTTGNTFKVYTDDFVNRTEKLSEEIDNSTRFKDLADKDMPYLSDAKIFGKAGGLVAYVTYISLIGVAIYKLIKFIVVGGIKLIIRTFRALGSLVSGSAPAEEATA